MDIHLLQNVINKRCFIIENISGIDSKASSRRNYNFKRVEECGFPLDSYLHALGFCTALS